MRVGILSSYDTLGGAGRAAYRLHQGLLQKGMASTFLTMHKSSDDPSVICNGGRLAKYTADFRADFDRLPLLLYPNRQKKFFTPSIVGNAFVREFSKRLDIANIHWVGAGFMGTGEIRRMSQPIVLTLHDSWAFTGGCHVPGACTNYRDGCGSCPQLGSSSKLDLSYFLLKRKRELWKCKKLTVVTTGKWLAEQAMLSKVFDGVRIEVVNPGLDLSVFKPIDKEVARDVFNIRRDVKLVLFGAVGAVTDDNKGYRYLESALQTLARTFSREELEIGIFGASRQRDYSADDVFRTHYLGSLRDTVSLPLLYSAADVMVVPSVQEAFGQTASESLACGTPVVAFDTTGLKDSIEHQTNGFLARPFDPAELASGIVWVLSDRERWDMLSKNARKTAVERFGLDNYVARYCEIYDQLASQA